MASQRSVRTKVAIYRGFEAGSDCRAESHEDFMNNRGKQQGQTSITSLSRSALSRSALSRSAFVPIGLVPIGFVPMADEKNFCKFVRCKWSQAWQVISMSLGGDNDMGPRLSGRLAACRGDVLVFATSGNGQGSR